MTVVACTLVLIMNSVPFQFIVTGELVKEVGNMWIVDISNSMEAFGMDGKPYSKYAIDKENCTKKEIKK